jgi:hypothetical protein
MRQKRPFDVERYHARGARAAQDALDRRKFDTASASERNRRAIMAEAAREDLRDALGRLCSRDAPLYVEEMRRLLNGEADLAALRAGLA